MIPENYGGRQKMNKKIMIVLMTLVLALTSVMGVYSQEDCPDCCGPNECVGEDAETPMLDLSTCEVEINDIKVFDDKDVRVEFERGEDLEIEVEFVSLQDAEDVQIMAFLTGYHRAHKFRDDVFDMTSTFDVSEKVRYHKTLTLKLPDDFEYDSGDTLSVRVQIADKYHTEYSEMYNVQVEPQRDYVVIQDIVLDPSTRVEAGRGLFASVRVRNMGENTEESIKVEISMPGLGLKATEYIDELDEDEATTSEDLFLRLPSCAEPGVYTVRATVEYADGDEETTKETTIEVGADPSCDLVKGDSGKESEKTVVTVPGRQDVMVGTTGSVYPVILQNNGVTARSYELSAEGLDSWAEYRFDPGAFVVVEAGEMETIYLYVTANDDAQNGEKVFMVSVETSGDEKQIALTANVVGASDEEEESPVADLDMRKALEIGFIVLVVLLIVLLLIVGFNKLKGSEEPEEVSGQTYY
jgi:hypothetical protein